MWACHPTCSLSVYRNPIIIGYPHARKDCKLQITNSRPIGAHPIQTINRASKRNGLRLVEVYYCCFEAADTFNYLSLSHIGRFSHSLGPLEQVQVRFDQSHITFTSRRSLYGGVVLVSERD